MGKRWSRWSATLRSAPWLIGAGRNFVAGADINELAKVAAGKSQRRPLLMELIRRMEDCAKPIVAAIQGNALGGGMELAMGAHYRVAAAGYRAPENHWLIPMKRRGYWPPSS